MTKQQAQEAKARCEAATKGPWGLEPESNGTELIAYDVPWKIRRVVARLPNGDHAADAMFLGSVRRDLPAALEMLTEAMKVLEKYHDLLKPHLVGCGGATIRELEAAEALLAKWEGRSAVTFEELEEPKR